MPPKTEDIEIPATVAAVTVKRQTTEEVLRKLLAAPDVDPMPYISALVARFDARAVRRAAKGAGEAEEE